MDGDQWQKTLIRTPKALLHKLGDFFLTVDSCSITPSPEVRVPAVISEHPGSAISHQPVNICGEDIEVVPTYKYLGVHLDDRLDWSLNTDALYRKGQSRLCF